MSEPPAEGFQLSADDPMMEQIEAATAGSRRSGTREQADDELPDEPVGAKSGRGEATPFEPEEVVAADEE